MAGYNEKLVGVGEWPVTTKSCWARSMGVADYNGKLVGGVGEWPAKTKSWWAE